MEKREPSCIADGNVNWYNHYGRWYGDSLKTRNKNTVWPSNPTSRHRRKPEETRVEKDTCIPLFIATLCTIARTWKQPRCPLTDEWIKKLWYIYTMEYYSAIKINAFESVLMKWMNLEPIIQSEVSQREKDTYHILTHIQNLEKCFWRIYLQGRNGETDIENRLRNMGEGRRGWDAWKE